jgi:hypothetical protein
MVQSFRPKFKGRSNEPTFYESGQSVRQSTNSNPDALGLVKTAWPLVGGVVILGVGLVWFMHSQDAQVHTEPILRLSVPAPGEGPQASQAANLVNTINVIKARYD